MQWVELAGISPKLISVVASAHIHTQGPLKHLWKKTSLNNWPKGVFSIFSKGGNIKNQVSNYLLRALLLALGESAVQDCPDPWLPCKGRAGARVPCHAVPISSVLQGAHLGAGHVSLSGVERTLPGAPV